MGGQHHRFRSSNLLFASPVVPVAEGRYYRAKKMETEERKTEGREEEGRELQRMETKNGKVTGTWWVWPRLQHTWEANGASYEHMGGLTWHTVSHVEIRWWYMMGLAHLCK
ncbi:hypothetical protein RIF29_38797 [Crotalaria pallida]|uniref:Uncharacterized protein n=1 Tax=Crotalaria pallida TaxID=3830 RepID=A0AAN9E691_CROPI